MLALWQAEFEPLLAAWVEELGVPTLRGCEVVGVAQDADGVDVEVSDGRTLRAAYLVGCDGGRSLVRKAAGIGFPGLEATTSWVIAEVEMDGEPELGFRRDALGTHAIGRRQEHEPIRLVLTEAEVGRTAPPTLDELRAALVGIYGSDFGLRRASWISWFTDAARQAATYRQGRVLVAGDAAHVHPPQGGQGLNVGVQDAVNLGWKLAQVVRGASPDGLLDTYHAERHPVGAQVLQGTMAQVALATPDDRHDALRAALAEVVAMDEPRRLIGARQSGLDVRYDLGDGHPLRGRRLPDLDLATPDGPTRALALLHEARHVLLALGGPDGAGGLEVAEPWGDRVRGVAATVAQDTCELPGLGEVSLPAAVLVRPDGHVAWTGALTDPDLVQALSTWCGRRS